MSNYPYSLDDDTTIWRVDDNITEISGTNFNQSRDAVFKIEQELGVKPSGAMNSLSEFLEVSFNSNGTIKSSALTAVGLVTLPIDNNDVGINAGIIESKLTLDFSTSSLYAMIQSNATLISAVAAASAATTTKLNSHIGGGPAPDLRHVVSHIDLNDVPSDSRDPAYVWTGLLDRDGNLRPATQLAEALLEINNELVGHENTTSDAHPASAITVDTSDFTQIPASADNVQTALQALDEFGEETLGVHRATQHSAGVPVDSRSQALKVYNAAGTVVNVDGYGTPVVSVLPVDTYVATFPGTAPVDSVVNGDNIIKFKTPATPTEIFALDAQFSQVRVGDTIRVNYGDGYNVEAVFVVESTRFTPGSEWVVRINGTNFVDLPANATARIDRSLFDPEIWGAIVAAPANAIPTSTFSGQGFLGSITVADPRVAVTLGIGFDVNQIDNTHYKLYLELYPTGNPVEKAIVLPFIDITGNAGGSPGGYTLDKIVQETNNSFRAAGYNYRFLAFQYEGNFGIAMTDAIDGASFSIINGDNSSGVLVPGAFTENVIGDATDGFDALGMGRFKSASASPVFQTSFPNSTAASNPTRIFMPRTRSYVANGSSRDFLRSQVNSTDIIDGYWDASISARTPSGSTVEVTYSVVGRLDSAGLKPGKTITVIPSVAYTDPSYLDVDYGRFMIKSVTFVPTCPGDPEITAITVINGIANTGAAVAASSGAGLPVRIYFGSDTVGFNLDNVIDPSPTGINYHRLHEIYVQKDASTFSHERVRMPVQAPSGALINTVNFHVSYASPKLKGYIDSSGSSFKRYLRFYVLNYDTATGEYDGYLGEPDTGDNVKNTGVIVSTRKNIPTRFYDKTNVDFLELTYIETSTTGTPTTITSIPAYCDIEVFPPLALDDQFVMLATAEINWQPSSGQNIVERVIDRRPVGSVSELEFTQSAKDFITAGERLLHGNGIIRGFDFDHINVSDNREIFYKGGVALVNGNFVTVNDGSVTIPQIVAFTTTLPQDVDWFICVDEEGNFVPMLSSGPSKNQAFAYNPINATQYYVQSVTFSELVYERRDLVVIGIVTAHIASVTINESDISDARKFITNETQNIPFTLYGNYANNSSGVLDGEQIVPIGNFNSFEQLSSWVNRSTSLVYGSFLVKVRGQILIDTTITLTDSNRPITFDGVDGGIFYVTAEKGIDFGYNINFKNLQFIYNAPGFVPSPGDKINISRFTGCLTSTSFGASTIENCKFDRSVTGARSPYIHFITSFSLTNVNVKNNNFSSSSVSTNPYISFTKPAAGTTYNELVDVNVSDNIGFGSGGAITFTTTWNIGGGQTLVNPPFVCRNVTIARNAFDGLIGFLTTSGVTTSGQVSKLVIENNTVKIIGTVDAFGILVNDNTTIAGNAKNSGTIYVLNNVCTSIFMAHRNDSWLTSSGTDIVHIDKNRLYVPNLATLQTDYGYPFGNSIGIRLRQTVNTSTVDTQAATNTTAYITNNHLDDAINPSMFDVGIECWNSGIISGNTISNFAVDGIQTFTDPFGSGFQKSFDINHNIISRHANQSITGAYIHLRIGTADQSTIYSVTDNFFNQSTTDGANENTLWIDGTSNTLAGTNVRVIAERNVNHIKTVKAHIGYVLRPGLRTYTKTVPSTIDTIDYITLYDWGFGSQITFLTGLGSADLQGEKPLTEVIPNGATVISVTADYNATDTDWNSGGFTISMYQASTGSPVSAGSASVTFSSSAIGTLSFSTSNLLCSIDNNSFLYLQVNGEPLTATKNVTISNCFIKYKY